MRRRVPLLPAPAAQILPAPHFPVGCRTPIAAASLGMTNPVSTFHSVAVLSAALNLWWVHPQCFYCSVFLWLEPLALSFHLWCSEYWVSSLQLALVVVWFVVPQGKIEQCLFSACSAFGGFLKPLTVLLCCLVLVNC